MTEAFATLARFSVTVLVLFAKSARGCGGYVLEIDHIRNCNSENVIEMSKNFTVVLTSNCQLKFTGCITARDTITTAEVDYIVHKDSLKRSGKKDGCNQLDNRSNTAETGLDTLGLPKRCPINKGTVCLDNKTINVGKYKLQMHIIAGHLEGKTLVTTNVGRACIEYSGRLINKLAKPFPAIG